MATVRAIGVLVSAIMVGVVMVALLHGSALWSPADVSIEYRVRFPSFAVNNAKASAPRLPCLALWARIFLSCSRYMCTLTLISPGLLPFSMHTGLAYVSCVFPRSLSSPPTLLRLSALLARGHALHALSVYPQRVLMICVMFRHAHFLAWTLALLRCCSRSPDCVRHSNVLSTTGGRVWR